MGKILLFIVLATAAATSYWLYLNLHTKEEYVHIAGGITGERYYQFGDPKDKTHPLNFDLIDPECAPEAILTKILYGYHIMLDTREHTPKYAGNSIDCNCCHFNGGNTLGGKNRGISLVGVTAIYPMFSKRDNKQISLKDRINNCFMRSLNGKPLPEGSIEMDALVAYLAWISYEVVDAPSLPWLGLDPIESTHVPDPVAGEKVFQMHCVLCHGEKGEGRKGAPPICGSNSYNDGAGMNTLPMLSSFIWQNMPHGQPILTKEEALDVASYLIKCPRPHFVKPTEIKPADKKTEVNK